MSFTGEVDEAAIGGGGSLLGRFVLSGHAVDHDVGQGVASPAPDPQTKAVELKSPEPLAGPAKGIGLKRNNGNGITIIVEAVFYK